MHDYALKESRGTSTEGLDDFPTPPWATRALLEKVLVPQDLVRPDHIVAEPCCGRGFMTRPLEEYFRTVISSDVIDYGCQYGVDDFLGESYSVKPDWFITNPPFNKGVEIVEKMQGLARRGVAIVERHAFLEGNARYNRLYSVNPPTIIAQYVERVPMLQGRCRRLELDKNGIPRRPTTQTSYCWLIWDLLAAADHPRFLWIPPARAALERFGDYEDDNPWG